MKNAKQEYQENLAAVIAEDNGAHAEQTRQLFERCGRKEDNGFLVLSRQRDQDILIGDDIRLRVFDIRGDKVRIGIKAPAAMPVDREEIRRAKLRSIKEKL